MRVVSRGALLIFALVFVALQVQPASLEVAGGLGADIDAVFTIINDEPVPVEVSLELQPFSKYLAGAATFSEEQFFLAPQESQNVQLRGAVPAGLGPEVHYLRYDVVARGVATESIEVRMPVSGSPTLEPRISASVRDVTQGTSLVVDVVLRNFGNVIAYYNLSMEVLERGSAVGSLRYPQPVQVLPGAEDRVTLLYTDFLEPGQYDVVVEGLVNGEVSVDARDSARVLLAGDDQRIVEGDDLVLELKRYGSQPRVSYAVRRDSSVLLEETIVASEDSLVVPTASLSPGVYVVSLSVAHSQGVDTQEFELVVARSGVAVGWLGWLVVLAAVLWAVFSAPTRLQLRIWWVSIRLHVREKRLNRLIYRAHEVERRYES